MDFMMSCDGMKPPITSGGGGGGLQCPNKTLIEHFGIFSAAGCGATTPGTACYRMAVGGVRGGEAFGAPHAVS